MKKLKIFTWILFMLAIAGLIATGLVYLKTKNTCIPSSCFEIEFGPKNCTSDCGGPRSYLNVYIWGLIDILMWISWIISILFNKKSKK